MFDPILPISYSSSVVVGPNYGRHKELIYNLIECDGIISIKKSIDSQTNYSKELFKVVFDSFKSNTLAKRISNAWSMTTQSTGLSDELMKRLKVILDE